MRTRTVLTVACAVAALTAGLLAEPRQKPAKTTTVTTSYAATVTFDDSPGYAVTSDAKGSYPATIQVTETYDSTGRLTKRSDQLVFSAGRRRWINYTPSPADGYSNYFGALNAPALPPNPGDPITPTSTGPLYVLNLTNLQAQQSGSRQAYFYTSAGILRFADYSIAGNPNPAYGSQALIVTRTSQNEWVVTTDNPAGVSYPNSTGTTPIAPPPGDVVQLDPSTPTDYANYHLPFKMAVVCKATGGCPVF